MDSFQGSTFFVTVLGAKRLLDGIRAQFEDTGTSSVWIPLSPIESSDDLQKFFADVEQYNPCLRETFTALLVGCTPEQAWSAWQVINDLDLGRLGNGDSDPLGEAWGCLQKELKFKSGNGNGEFFTPLNIAGMLSLMVTPQPGESISDPTCGTGGMLTEAAAAVHKEFGYAPDGHRQPMFFHGTDINHRLVLWTRINMAAWGYANAVIMHRDALRDPPTQQEIHQILIDRHEEMLQIQQELASITPDVV